MSTSNYTTGTPQHLPHDECIECRVLAAVLYSACGATPDEIREITNAVAVLPVDAFFLPRHRSIWHAIRRLHRRGQAPEPLAVVTTLEPPIGDGMMPYVFELAAESAGTAVSLEYDVKQLLELKRRRDLTRAAYALAAVTARGGSWSTIGTLMSEILRLGGIEATVRAA